MKASGVSLLAGIVLLLSGPLVALTPLFTPPSNGCPCPEGLDVSTPFGDAGVIVGVAGFGLVIYGALQQRREGPRAQTTAPHGDDVVGFAGVSGVVLLVLSFVLSGIDLTGPGWSILLYQGQGLYLGILGIGMLLFAVFASMTRKRGTALFLAAGVILCGISLLLSFTLRSEFELRCLPDIECSPLLATSTVSEMVYLGYVLAAGTFLIALGLSSYLNRGRGAEVES